MSKNADVPRNKDGTPDKRTVEGREAASSESDKSKHAHNTRSTDKNADVPRNQDGTPDKRTVEGREAASSEGDKSKHAHNTRSTDKNADVPRNLDGTPDKRTVEGKEAAAEEGDSNKHRATEGQTRLDGELDKRTVEGRKEVEAEAGGSSGSSGSSGKSSSSKDSKDSKDSEAQFDEGDRVVFNIGSNNLHGTISRVITKDAVVDGRVAHGSKDEPRYAVEYEGTGKEQIRTESALQKDEDKSQKSNQGGSNNQGGGQSPNSGSKKDDRYRKGHKFEEGETVVFHIGKNIIHGKIAKVSDSKSGEYKVKVGDDTIKAKEDELEKESKGSKDSKDSKGSKDSKDSGDHKFNEGDAVTFNIGLNELHGHITKVITDDSIVDGRVAHGSKDEPRYAVEYDATGKEQIRTEGALKKDDEKMEEDKSNKRKREDEEKKDKDGKDKSSTTKEPSPKKTKGK